MTRGLGANADFVTKSWLGLNTLTRAYRLSCNLKEIFMQWQTPTATDLRFGFEITLYVSNR